MDTIELRPSKLKWFQAIGLLILGILVLNYFAFFNKHYRGILLLEISAAIVSIFILFFVYKMLALFRRINKPFVTITETSIQFYENGLPILCNWSDISGWKITEENNSKFLLLETLKGPKKIDISSLDKSPHEIRNIVQRLK
jgi:hypothetical protein